ncbi:MAG: hypothetical protein P4L84_23105 [Isosphaeraceae bacterium]|nr:hypothetical protein [Isosphaeraceae bacterium]
MTNGNNRWAWAVGLALFAGVPGLAQAQVPSGAGNVQAGTYGASGGMAANPYANPYLNPFLNPYMMQTQPNVGPQNMLLFMMAAQQMNGGIGSGQISGSRPGPSARPAPTQGAATRAAGIPSGRTARYFNRSYADGGGASRFYGRQESYFPRTR